MNPFRKLEGELKRDAALLIDTLRCIGVQIAHGKCAAAAIGSDIDDLVASACERSGLKLFAVAQDQREFTFIRHWSGGLLRRVFRSRLLSHLLGRGLLDDDDRLLGLRLLVRINGNGIGAAAIQQEISRREAIVPMQPVRQGKPRLRRGINQRLERQILIQRRQMFEIKSVCRKRIQQLLKGGGIVRVERRGSSCRAAAGRSMGTGMRNHGVCGNGPATSDRWCGGDATGPLGRGERRNYQKQRCGQPDLVSRLQEGLAFTLYDALSNPAVA